VEAGSSRAGAQEAALACRRIAQLDQIDRPEAPVLAARHLAAAIPFGRHQDPAIVLRLDAIAPDPP
jgi:hypothetical protein